MPISPKGTEDSHPQHVCHHALLRQGRDEPSALPSPAPSVGEDPVVWPLPESPSAVPRRRAHRSSSVQSQDALLAALYLHPPPMHTWRPRPAEQTAGARVRETPPLTLWLDCLGGVRRAATLDQVHFTGGQTGFLHLFVLWLQKKHLRKCTKGYSVPPGFHPCAQPQQESVNIAHSQTEYK